MQYSEDMTQKLVNRVPSIVTLYWVIKIASTTLGETGADWFSMTIDIGYAMTIAIFLALFVVLFILKLRAKSYAPILYWSLFTSSAILGTAISDFIDRTLKLGYTWGALILFILLLIALLVWYLVEKNVSVETITTTRSEIFYWIAFLIANTLGTALGDYLADELSIGFIHSALGIFSVLVLVTILNYTTKISKILLFWIAFVLTRPFGATFGDLLTKDPSAGGLGIGTTLSSVFFFAMLVIALYFEVKENKKRTLA